MAIDVCITVDLEFTIAGCLHYPQSRTPVGHQSVECLVGDESHGLSYMLEVLRRYDIKATFFVETNHVHFFGDRPMGSLVERLLTDGHDVQLHIHPVWDAFRNPDWQTLTPEHQPTDRFDDRSMDEAIRLIAEGVRTMKAWTGMEPVAFRTGGMAAERALYPALAAVGLHLASNVGLGIHRPSDPILHRKGGRVVLDGILEVPVTTYTINLPFIQKLDKCLTVVGSSLAEFRAALSDAAGAAAGPIVILTHPFEFVTADSEYRELTVHPCVKTRFNKLCKYLTKNPQHYRMVTFREQAAEWLQAGPTEDIEIDLPPYALFHRYLAKKLDRFTASKPN